MAPVNRQQRIWKDIRLSGMLGPFRIGVPMLAYFFLYPIIINRSGLNVLGLWSLIATLSTYVGLANVGFSALFIRAVGAADTEAEFISIAREHTSAVRFYAAVTALLLIFWAIMARTLISNLDVSGIYCPTLLASVALYIIGLGFSITAQLDAAILSGAHQTYAVQIIDTFSPVIVYSVALGGALVSRPIEGLTIGSFFAALFQFVAYKLRLRKHFPTWQKHALCLSFSETVRTCTSLMRRGVHFYTISLGFILREPIFRAVIATTLGLSAAGLYEIASRVPAAIREFFVAGSRSLYPAFSHYHARGLIVELHHLICRILIVFIAFGHMALLTYGVGAEAFLRLWLPVVHPDLVSATRIMTLFWAITVLNVPFWYLLQANGNEKIAARSLFYHTAAIIVLYPLSMVINLSLQSILWYWVLTSILTQVSIYIAAERTAGAVRPTLLSRQIILLGMRFFVAGVLLVGIEYGILSWSLSSWVTLVILSGNAVLIFSMFLLPMVWPVVKALFFARISE